jgi:hypothetical protein
MIIIVLFCVYYPVNVGHAPPKLIDSSSNSAYEIGLVFQSYHAFLGMS